MLAIDFGSDAVVSEFICITNISLGFASGSSRAGEFCENRPSQYTLPSVRTALNKVGIVAEARIMSALILSLRLLKASNSPLRTLAVPMRTTRP
jgi:hypothetical protein